MASISPYIWVSAQSSSSSCAKKISLPYTRFNSRFVFLASSSENGASAGETEVPDNVRLAFSKAEAYRKGRMLSSPQGPKNPKKSSMEPAAEEMEVPIAVKIAVEKAEVYRKNKQVFVEELRDPGEEEKSLGYSRNGLVENKLNKEVGLKISSKDFLGLDFSEKKSYRRNPSGLVPLMGPLLEGAVPEVEIIVGDASKFQKTERASTSFEAVDNTGLYKPKVSTWGVFPRPINISKTFGGGRVVESGEMLETPGVKKENEKRSTELISVYKKKMGLSVDTKTRVECEKALREGDDFMERGQLRGALPYYEKVMKSLVFQTDLHGFAALQWSICQDSLSRPNEARIMYDKLKSHPNAEVSKKARQFAFSFQAMAVMKVVEGTSIPIKTGYEDYFEVFVDNNIITNSPSIEEQNESLLEQVYPYLIFLLSPMLIFLFVVVKKFI